MPIETLDDLFKLELQQLYDEERRLVGALPKMACGSSSARLREAFEEHLVQTRGHVRRLEECFKQIDRNPETAKADGIEGLISESQHLIHRIEQSPLRDAGLIGAARRIEHYEIAGYSSMISLAKVLGHLEIARLMEEILKEEQAADSRLTDIAGSAVNEEALQLGAHQMGNRA